MTLPEFPEQLPPRRLLLKFEPQLVPRLRAAQAALNKRFTDLAGASERDPGSTMQTIEDCARQFSAVRHIEATMLFPTLVQAVESDRGARGQLMELRLVGLVMARGVLRLFDEFLQAARAEVFITDAATRVSSALARYAQHSERAVYPLYELIGEQRQDSMQVA